jgi:uncharacterized phage protein gp47/JayE
VSGTINANTKGKDQIVSDMAAAAQAAAYQINPADPLTISPGSPFLVIFEAVSGVFLWLQAYALSLLLFARAATSNNSDLDSWMAQFQFARIGALAATCSTVILTRLSASQPVTIVPGGTVQTADGSQQFGVVVDTTQSAWNAGAGGYVMAAGTTSCQVTVQALVSGAGGNVAAGTITAFASGIVGADLVNNTGAATGGASAENDPSFRARFWNYLQYLFRATGAAIQYAVQSVQVGAEVILVENYDEAGNWRPGYFYGTCDDGSGVPPASFVTAAAAQADATRALGVAFGMHATTRLTVNVSAQISVAAGFNVGAVEGAAQTVVAAFVQSCIQGQNLSYFSTGVVLTGVPGVAELLTLTLTGTTADIAAGRQKIVAGTVVVASV